MPTFIEKSVNEVRYWEMLIGEVQPDTPIAIALHYMSGDARSMEALFNGYEKPLRVITMQGSYVYKDNEVEGFSWFPDHTAFYDRSEAEQAQDIRTASEPIVEVIRHLKTTYPGAKIAIMGMSQGGDLALSIATHHPELLDLVLPMAGRISAPMRPSEVSKGRLPHILMMNGVDDPIVTIAGAREAVKWLQAAGFAAELKEYAGIEHRIAKAMVQDIQDRLSELNGA